MKSKHQDRALQTSCKKCQFATYNENTQEGCAAGRLDKLKEYVIDAYDDDKEFYVIDCLCNMFRTPSWNGGTPDVDRARAEVRPLFSIIIDSCNSESELSYRKKLSRTTESLIKMTYDPKRVAIIYSARATATKETKHSIRMSFDKLGEAGFNPQIVAVAEDKMRDYDTFKRAGGAYFIAIAAGEEVPSALLSDIDMQLNEEMSRAVVFENNGLLVISFIAYSARFLLHETYESFEEHICSDSKDQGLYLRI